MVLATALLSLALAQVPSSPQAVHPGVVTGVVHGAQEPGRMALPDAIVEWWGVERRNGVTDGRGGYRLDDLPPGRGRLRVTHAGYEVMELDVDVPSGGTVVLDIELRRRPVMLAPVQVLVDPSTGAPVAADSTRGSPASGLSEASLRAVEAGSGLVEAGLGSATRRLPGEGGENPDPRNVLFMRGSSTELKLVTLDGAPVYTPFHVGGIIQSFDPGTLGGAELFVGGAPARYDGGLSYILDLRTREPSTERIQGSGAVDLMSARGSLEGPLGERVRFLVGSRGLHGGGEALGQGRPPYGYADGLLRLDLLPAVGHSLRFTGFWNRESVFLDFPGLGGSGPTLPLPSAAEWGNAVAALRWRMIRGTTRFDLQWSLSRYDAELPLHAPDPVLADGATERTRVAAELGVDQWGGRVRYGASLDLTDMEFGARRILRPDLPAYVEYGRARTLGAYVDGSWALPGDVAVRGGVRVDGFSGEQVPRLAPRLAITWLLAPEASLTLAAGRYHQHARPEAAEDQVVLWSGLEGEQALAPAIRKATLPVAGASHLVLALDQQLVPGVRLGLEGFLKEFSTPEEGTAPVTSSGVDLRVQRVGDRVTGWVGYSLSWFWSTPADSSSAESFTGRHLLTAGLDGRLGTRGGVSTRVTFGDGLPYTSVPVTPDVQAPVQSVGRRRFAVGSGEAPTHTFAGPRPDAFLRVDAEVYGVLNPTLGGRRTELRPFLRLLNALDRRDALFYYFEPWRGEGLTPLAGMSVLPVAGIEWRF